MKDGSNTVQLEDLPQDEYLANHTFEQFIFHPDYIVDALLFREVIGSVTNTAFVRPEISYKDSIGTHSITYSGGIMGAWALAPEATAGKSRNYGMEADLKLRYSSTEYLSLVWTVAALKPGEALSLGENTAIPGPLYTTQLDLFIRF